MSTMLRRFELLLPRRSNTGELFPEDLFAQTQLELRGQFGAVSSETQIIRGFWTQAGQVYRDELLRVFVDISDSPEAREFFREFKDVLKKRFDQLDIWMTSHPVELH
jgi:hypothetical protein